MVNNNMSIVFLKTPRKFVIAWLVYFLKKFEKPIVAYTLSFLREYVISAVCLRFQSIRLIVYVLSEV